MHQKYRKKKPNLSSLISAPNESSTSESETTKVVLDKVYEKGKAEGEDGRFYKFYIKHRLQNNDNNDINNVSIKENVLAKRTFKNGEEIKFKPYSLETRIASDGFVDEHFMSIDEFDKKMTKRVVDQVYFSKDSNIEYGGFKIIINVSYKENGELSNIEFEKTGIDNTVDSIKTKAGQGTIRCTSSDDPLTDSV